MTSSFRIEHDSMGELQGARRCAVGRADPARGGEFPDQRPEAAARLHPRARPGQAGRGARQHAAGAPRAAARRRRSRAPPREVAAGAARPALPDRRLPDRLGHQHQHERQRGDRRARRDPAPGSPGAPERSRQHGPEQQRLDSDRDPRECRARRSQQHLLPALEQLREALAGQGAARWPASSRPGART